MSYQALTDATAVEQALKKAHEAQKSHREPSAPGAKGEAAAQVNRFLLQHEGRLHDAKASFNVAYRIQHGTDAPDSLIKDEAHVHQALDRLGFPPVDRQPTSVEGELAWRLAAWEHLQATQDLKRVQPTTLNAYDLYRPQRGIWTHRKRTAAIRHGGITVGVMHSGAHYPDDFGDHSALYSYPRTQQRGLDAAEIAATKATAELQLPIFVSARPTPKSDIREVRLGWVEGWEDESELFLISFEQEPPEKLLSEDDSSHTTFVLQGNRRTKQRGTVTRRPDQARFKLQVFQRYGPRCPLSGIDVPEMLEAAHLRPVKDEGTDDPRNGLPLSAALHRAFDAHLFAINPHSLEVETAPQGPTLKRLQITTGHLRDLGTLPHKDALQWRYDKWREKHKL